MCVCVWMCGCVLARHVQSVCACVCVCVCVRACLSERHADFDICVYVCVFVSERYSSCVCVCVSVCPCLYVKSLCLWLQVVSVCLSVCLNLSA